MLSKVFMIGRWFIYSIVGAAALLCLMLYAGCTSDMGRERPPSGGLGSGPDYYGPATLEERIAGADAIVRARLLSVSAVSEQLAGQTDYIAALDYRFRVLEYLRGSGASELVGVVYDASREFKTAAGARTEANALKNSRDTQWDDREAIVFLIDDHSELPSSNQADRYRLGSHYAGNDYYTIASRTHKRWLPAASAGGASGARGASGGGQRFLLDASADSGGASGARGASGKSASAPTITLTDMKAKIAANDREVAAGGGSEAYKECLYLKHRWEREVRYRKEKLGGVYHYTRHDKSVGSGLPSGIRVYTDSTSGYLLTEYGETPPSNIGEMRVTGRDHDLFVAQWPAIVHTVRPLPAGEYKFYYSNRPQQYIICDAHPEEEMKRDEVFVTVTAPTGTVHEALFDPVAIGAAVGVDRTNGVLTPSAFTIGGVSTSLQSLKWQGGSVTLELSPAASLTGYALDFIALDGSVALSLDGGVSTAAVETLTWTVSAQPWQAGDQLMLRIRDASPTPMPTPVPTEAAAADSGNPSISEVTGTSVRVSWDRVRPSGTFLQDVRVNYRLAGATDWTFGEYVDVSTWSSRRQAATVSGLMCGTNYEFQIEAQYSNRWHHYGRISATTVCDASADPPPTPDPSPTPTPTPVPTEEAAADSGNPSISEVTGISVRVSWDRVRPSGTFLQDVRVNYRLAGATDWTLGAYVDVSTWSSPRQAATVSGLTCGTNYEFQIEAQYSNRWHHYGRISATTGGC